MLIFEMVYIDYCSVRSLIYIFYTPFSEKEFFLDMKKYKNSIERYQLNKMDELLIFFNQ